MRTNVSESPILAELLGEKIALTELIAGPGVFKDVRLEQGLPLKQSRENETLSLVCK
ncbi:MAG: hypothetical protein ACPGYL_08150 [Rhodospirillaceae bacterium]